MGSTLSTLFIGHLIEKLEKTLLFDAADYSDSTNDSMRPKEPILRSSLRLTEFPYRRWWGFSIRFVKTFEVIFFKCLQFLAIYRPQKSIVGIPSLAIPNVTSLQAVVYNGTQEEVLGFRPRRLIHRIFRGVPDLEYFERIGFQLSVSDSALRTVDGSTETRGFVHLQLPWQMPWRPPKVAWLRMAPRGVETLLGPIQLGDYEITSSPVFFLTPEIKRVLISDIDDTIKDSNILHTTGVRDIVSGLFRGNYYTYQAIEGMAELYQKMADSGTLIIYVTSTPYQLAPFLLKFLREAGFPQGPVFLRWLGYGRFGHKWRTLHRILSNIETQKCWLIGDSGEQDLQIYRRITAVAALGEKVEKILIRHVPGSPRPRPIDAREIFYDDIHQLSKHLTD